MNFRTVKSSGGAATSLLLRVTVFLSVHENPPAQSESSTRRFHSSPQQVFNIDHIPVLVYIFFSFFLPLIVTPKRSALQSSACLGQGTRTDFGSFLQ